MKAIVLDQFGSIDNLQLKEVPVPVAGAGELLIKIENAAVNPYDLKVIEVYKEQSGVSLPVIPGSELSGVVVATGEGVTKFKEGDAVCGNPGRFGGGFAQYITTHQDWMAKKPASLSFETAAAIPVASLIAWKALFDEGKLTAGQKVLIHGASGNVGGMAVQEAKQAGAYVIATGSGKNEQRVKALGADVFIDYTKQDFSTAVKEVDVVLDTVGGKMQTDSFKVLKEGGYLISLIEAPSKELATQYKVHAKVVYGGPNANRLEQILLDAAGGKIKAPVDRVFALSDAVAALKAVKQAHPSGKILLRP
ncbi:NADP-dependent oxidoreductase [Niabella soli]|uniref:NADPH:quinone reductase n=1 Tax=Niabella soli DSM 19437 TaxID=929713 RepID=W0EZ74_9BACT|nr:NADP-dependent oxidoreductase [Niabella soli]AHF14386.1 NADPH:quinone reductase [Niabella soli DSM 19437]